MSSYALTGKGALRKPSLIDNRPGSGRTLLNVYFIVYTMDYYHALLGHLGWKDCGTVLAGGVMNVGDIHGKPSLVEARTLGASIL